VYSLPAGSTVTNGDTSDASDINTPLQDLETDMNTARPGVAGGTGGTTASEARTGLGLDTVMTETSDDVTIISPVGGIMPADISDTTGPVILRDETGAAKAGTADVSTKNFVLETFTIPNQKSHSLEIPDYGALQPLFVTWNFSVFSMTSYTHAIISSWISHVSAGFKMGVTTNTASWEIAATEDWANTSMLETTYHLFENDTYATVETDMDAAGVSANKFRLTYGYNSTNDRYFVGVYNNTGAAVRIKTVNFRVDYK